MVPRRPRKPGKQLPPLALYSPLAREENLPAPLVYYPNREGAFIAFAVSRDEQPALCECAEGAVRNLIRLSDGVDYGLFPDSVARAMIGQADPMAALTFRAGLCHRCNLVKPSLRYCHEAGGTHFVQTYGWYINQTYLRVGIHPTEPKYLPDVCPPDYHDVLNRIQALTGQVRELRAALFALVNGERRDIPRTERSPLPNVTATELEALESLELRLNKPKYDLRNAVENATRAEFGVKAIGEGWLSETQLYYIICRLLPGEQVVRHYRPEWMEGLELDVYVPRLSLAVEYQGQQHFHPIKVWGGEEALHQLQERDARKVQICREAGVHLIHVDYTEPLTEEHILQRLSSVPLQISPVT